MSQTLCLNDNVKVWQWWRENAVAFCTLKGWQMCEAGISFLVLRRAGGSSPPNLPLMIIEHFGSWLKQQDCYGQASDSSACSFQLIERMQDLVRLRLRLFQSPYTALTMVCGNRPRHWRVVYRIQPGYRRRKSRHSLESVPICLCWWYRRKEF